MYQLIDCYNKNKVLMEEAERETIMNAIREIYTENASIFGMRLFQDEEGEAIMVWEEPLQIGKLRIRETR